MFIFSNNTMRDTRAKQATQDLWRIQNSCERDKETKQYENLPNKIPYYFWVSQEVFCSKRFRYLGSENVSKTCFYYCWVLG